MGVRQFASYYLFQFKPSLLGHPVYINFPNSLTTNRKAAHVSKAICSALVYLNHSSPLSTYLFLNTSQSLGVRGAHSIFLLVEVNTATSVPKNGLKATEEIAYHKVEVALISFDDKP